MSSVNKDKSEQQPQIEKFGTFLGVYTPSVLTILGLIMYLRFGWVVGNVGLPITLFIVTIASSITFITALSASAIGTNMRVGVGGEYFMISRSLGLELGGAIGIPLFLCRTLSITFYSFGLVESILLFWPASWGVVPSYMLQLLTAIVIITITIVSGKSAALTLKLQIPIMFAVGLSIIALILGIVTSDFRTPELLATYRTAPDGFWYVFAVFFPAVTGFTAGIGMSGDLKDPRKSIPKGTLLAVLTGYVIYMTIPVLLALTNSVSYEELAEPGIIWIKIAILGAWFIYPGVWGAILSSAFGSVLGGPRVLQALAQDGLAPKFLARLSKTGQPTIATWICGGIALTAVALGGLNTVAQFVTILFLTLYVMINLSAGLEKLVGDPSFRPTINVPWYISLLGSIGAIVVMFLISPIACVAAVILESILYFFIRGRSMQKRWGDVRAGFWLAFARFTLLNLRQHRQDPRNWRPQILLFAGDPSKRIPLVRMASWFNQDRGLVTVSQLIVGDLRTDNIQIKEKLLQMESDLNDAGLVAFPEVNVVNDFLNGAIEIAQANGIANLRSNTIMFGWSEKRERLESMISILRAISKAGKSMIITRINWSHEPGQEKRIDLWWRGKQRNGDLMLLLAYLLSLNPEWSGTKVIVRSIVMSDDEREMIKKSLSDLISEARIQAETEVIVKPADNTIAQVIHRKSRGADIVLLGLKEPEPGTESEYVQRLIDLANGLSTIIFVRNAGEFAGNLI